MIRSVHANVSSFRAITFEPGLNIVISDQTQESTDRDSRNGVGKSLLIEIIHFCLGSRFDKRSKLSVEQLHDWKFTIVLDIDGSEYRVTRNTTHSRTVEIEGNFRAWSSKPQYNANSGAWELSVEVWNIVLGEMMFGLPFSPNKRRILTSVSQLNLVLYTSW